MQQAIIHPGSQLKVGQVLSNRWKLVRLLGEGGMGAVYEAEGLNGEGKRAIKILHPEYATEEEVLRRFYAEAETAKRLEHPNVAKIFELATAEDGTPYLVMELLEGIPLAAYVKPGVPHPVQRAAPIIHAVLMALTEAHRRGIVHRDLKPENVFLVRQASGQFGVKVLDFGIAKVMDAAGGMGSKTRTGILLGTPGYMSPEQLKNAKTVDPRSDLWSVGVMFYEMLTGREAFEADTEFGRLTAVLTQDPVPVDRDNPQLAPWRDFFARALSRDLDHRFQSAEEMATTLLALARGAPVPPSVERAAAKPSEPPAVSQVVPSHVTRPSPQFPTPTATPEPVKVEVRSATPTRSGTMVPLWLLIVTSIIDLIVGFIVGWLVARG